MSGSILTTPTFDTVTYLRIPYSGSAAAINSQNKIAGTAGTSSTTSQYAHAYLYDYNAGNLLDLGTLNGGLTSGAADINELNQVVGTSWLVTQLTSVYDPTQCHAFLWENGEMTDLNALIAADSGWILTAATYTCDVGDGSAVANEPNPSTEYTLPATFFAVLTVTDGQSLTAAAQVEIKVRKATGRK